MSGRRRLRVQWLWPGRDGLWVLAAIGLSLNASFREAYLGVLGFGVSVEWRP